MSIKYNEIDFQEIFQDLVKVCKTERVCGKCGGLECLVGYSKDCIAVCRLNETAYVEDGIKNIPHRDIEGGYDEYDTLYAISHLLSQCHSCKEAHDENCIINVVRSCLEMIEFGKEQGYEGTPLQYVLRLSEIDKKKSDIVLTEYQKKKEAGVL
jgi:hypothetical protein